MTQITLLKSAALDTVDREALVRARAAAAVSRPANANVSNPAEVLLDTAVSSANGSLYPAAGWGTTGSIEVNPGDYWSTSKGSNSHAYFDHNGQFVSGGTAIYQDTWNLVPAGAYFVRYQAYPGSALLTATVKQGTAAAVAAGANPAVSGAPFGGPSAAYMPQFGKACVFLGDSTAYTGYFISPMLAGTGMSQLANYSKPGRAMRGALLDGSDVALTASDFAGADTVMIELGVNDFLGNRALGTIADAASGYGGAGSFYNDTWVVLNTLIGWAPTLSILMATPMQQTSAVDPNPGGYSLLQYVDAIIEVAEMFGVPVVDAYRKSGFNALTLATYTSDNLHPNPDGGARLGALFAGAWNALP